MIVFKYLDEFGVLETIKDGCVLLRTPDRYGDINDSNFFAHYDKEYKLFINYQMFKNLYEELIQNKKKPVNLRKTAMCYKFAMQSEVARVKTNGEYNYQCYLDMFKKFIYSYLNKKERELRTEFRITIKKSLEKIRKDSLVCCFCKSFKETLMWDHYTKGHKGACIAFEIEDEKEYQPVKYSDKPVPFELYKALKMIFGHELLKQNIDSSNEKYSFLMKPFFTKDQKYSYEKEIRRVFSKESAKEKLFIKRIDDQDEFFYQMPKIHSIYLGINASKKLIEAAKKSGYETLQMKRDTKSFKLYEEKLF